MSANFTRLCPCSLWTPLGAGPGTPFAAPQPSRAVILRSEATKDLALGLSRGCHPDRVPTGRAEGSRRVDRAVAVRCSIRNFTRRSPPRRAEEGRNPKSAMPLLPLRLWRPLRLNHARTRRYVLPRLFLCQMRDFPADPQRHALAFGSRLNVMAHDRPRPACRSPFVVQSALRTPQFAMEPPQFLAFQCCFFVKCEICLHPP